MQLISWATVFVALFAAACGVRAATIEVRDSMDQFIGDLRRQGRWSAAAAGPAAMAAVLQVIERAVI